MQNTLQQNVSQRLTRNILFNSNEIEVRLHSDNVWKDGREAASEQLQLVGTTFTQC